MASTRQIAAEQVAREEYILATLRRAHTIDGERFIQEHLPATEYVAIDYFEQALRKIKGKDADEKALQRVVKYIEKHTSTQLLFGGKFYESSVMNDNEAQYYDLDPAEGIKGVFANCKCGANDYMVRVVQTRSADEGSTTMLTCLKCGITSRG